jgi:hypothetical protein
MAVHLVIAIAKPVPVLLDQRRGYRRIAEARVAIRVGRRPSENISLSGLGAVMEALLCGLRICLWWRRVVSRPWMRTPGQYKGKQCYCKHLLHDLSSSRDRVVLLKRTRSTKKVARYRAGKREHVTYACPAARSIQERFSGDAEPWLALRGKLFGRKAHRRSLGCA